MVLQGSSSDNQQVVNVSRTYSRASISFIISALKMSAEPAYSIGKRVFAYGEMMVDISTALGPSLMGYLTYVQA